MSEHTPGPWSIHPRSATSVVTEGGRLVASTGGRQSNIKDEGPENEANARLIVEVPELLEACLWFVAQLDDRVLVRDISRDGEPDWPMRMLRFTAGLSGAVAAIAKAEGDTP